MRLPFTIWTLCVWLMLFGAPCRGDRVSLWPTPAAPPSHLAIPDEMRPSPSSPDASVQAKWRAELRSNLKRVQVKSSLGERINARIVKVTLSAIDAVFGALGRWLEKGKLSEGPFAVFFYILAAFFQIVGWLFVAAVIGLFAYLLLKVAMMISVRIGLRRNLISRVTPASETVEPRRTEQELLAAAESQAASGNFRDAFRFAYLAALMLLDSAGLVRYAEDATNWEYIRGLREAGSEAPRHAFQPMTEAFDRLIYGKSAVSDGDYRHCVERYRELREAIS